MVTLSELWSTNSGVTVTRKNVEEDTIPLTDGAEKRGRGHDLVERGGG